MQKIISLYQRNYDGDRLVHDEVAPGAEWVPVGEGRATVKWDGTAVMVRAGRLFKRYDAKQGKTAPPDFEPAQEPDPVTGHWPGWVPVTEKPEDRWLREAFANYTREMAEHGIAVEDRTYEALGPKIQGNPYALREHTLAPHGSATVADAPRDFQGLKQFFTRNDALEGIVWHHPDGRMVKIKRRDFGLPWPVKAEGAS